MRAVKIQPQTSRRGNSLHVTVTTAVVVAAISGGLALSTVRTPSAEDPILEKAWVNAMASAALDAALDDLASGGDGQIGGEHGYGQHWGARVVDFGSALQVQAQARKGHVTSVAEAIVDKVGVPWEAALVLTTPGARIDGLGTEVILASDESGTSAGLANELDAELGLDLATLAESYQSAADTRVAEGTYRPRWGDAASGDLQIVVSEGDLELRDDGRGAGVLVVRGDLVISGSFEWLGAILVEGDVLLATASASALRGTMLIGGDLRQERGDGTPGTLSIESSEDARTAIADLVGYRTVERLRAR
jgi:hypothetical protein